jgi:hypothetical protein
LAKALCQLRVSAPAVKISQGSGDCLSPQIVARAGIVKGYAPASGADHLAVLVSGTGDGASAGDYQDARRTAYSGVKGDRGISGQQMETGWYGLAKPPQ